MYYIIHYSFLFFILVPEFILIIIVFVLFDDKLLTGISLFIAHISDIGDHILSELSSLLNGQLLITFLNILDILSLNIRLDHFLPVLSIKGVLTISILLLIFIDLVILVLLLLLLLDQIQVLQPSTTILCKLLHLCEPIIITSQEGCKMAIQIGFDLDSSTNTIKTSNLHHEFCFLLFIETF